MVPPSGWSPSGAGWAGHSPGPGPTGGGSATWGPAPAGRGDVTGLVADPQRRREAPAVPEGWYPPSCPGEFGRGEYVAVQIEAGGYWPFWDFGL
eukprot:8003889-Alexandrium_andersonii.AAC.1